MEISRLYKIFIMLIIYPVAFGMEKIVDDAHSVKTKEVSESFRQAREYFKQKEYLNAMIGFNEATLKPDDHEKACAEVFLGKIYYFALGVERDLRKALTYFNRVFQQESSPLGARLHSAYFIGCMHYWGEIVPENQKMAFAYFKWIEERAGDKEYNFICNKDEWEEFDREGFYMDIPSYRWYLNRIFHPFSSESMYGTDFPKSLSEPLVTNDTLMTQIVSIKESIEEVIHSYFNLPQELKDHIAQLTGITPAHVIARTPNFRWNYTIKQITEKTEKSLLDEMIKKDPNTTTDESWTPLFLAHMYGNYEATRYLLEHGAFFISDIHNRTPLHWAAYDGNIRAIQLFLMPQAFHDRSLADNVRNLRKYNFTSNYQEQTAKYEELSLEKLIFKRDKIGITATEIAYHADKFDAYRRLLEIACANNQELKQSKLHLPESEFANIMLSFDHYRGLENFLAESAESLEILDAGTLDISPILKPMHIAAAAGCQLLLGLLIQQDQNQLNAKSYSGYTPSEWAAYFGHLETVMFLENPRFKGDIRFINSYFIKRKIIEAALCGNQDKLALSLLKNDRVNHNFVACLHLAAQQGKKLIIYCLARAIQKIEDSPFFLFRPWEIESSPPLYAAAENGHAEVLELLKSSISLLKRGKQLIGDLQASIDGPFLLHVAAKNGHIECVDFLLKNGLDVDATDKTGITPLHLAAENGHLKVVQLLLDTQANPFLKDAQGNTPLHAACVAGHKRVAELLLRIVQLRSIRNSDDLTALELAELFSRNLTQNSGNMITEGAIEKLNVLLLIAIKAKSPLVQDLIKKGAKPTSHDHNGRQAIHIAIITQKEELVELLLERFPETAYALTIEGQNPLHIACLASSKGPIVKLLIEKGVKLEIRDHLNQTPLHGLSNHNNGVPPFLFRLLSTPQALGLLNTQDFQRRTALHLTTMQGRHKCVIDLLWLGADRTIQDNRKFTPLHYAVANNNMPLVNELIRSIDYEKLCNITLEFDYELGQEGDYQTNMLRFIKDKVENKLKLNNEVSGAYQEIWDQMKPLYLTSEEQFNEYCIKHFMKPHTHCLQLTDFRGNTPLHLAAEANPSILRELLKLEPNAFLKNVGGEIPLHIAVKKSKIENARLLLEYAPESVKCQDIFRSTALYYAISEAYAINSQLKKEMVILLLNHGADPSHKNCDNENILHIAIRTSENHLVQLLLQQNTIAKCINASDKLGNRPLHIAAEKGDWQIIKSLLEYGADKNLVNFRNLKPRDCAQTEEIKRLFD